MAIRTQDEIKKEILGLNQEYTVSANADRQKQIAQQIQSLNQEYSTASTPISIGASIAKPIATTPSPVKVETPISIGASLQSALTQQKAVTPTPIPTPKPAPSPAPSMTTPPKPVVQPSQQIATNLQTAINQQKAPTTQKTYTPEEQAKLLDPTSFLNYTKPQTPTDERPYLLKSLDAVREKAIKDGDTTLTKAVTNLLLSIKPQQYETLTAEELNKMLYEEMIKINPPESQAMAKFNQDINQVTNKIQELRTKKEQTTDQIEKDKIQKEIDFYNNEYNSIKGAGLKTGMEEFGTISPEQLGQKVKTEATNINNQTIQSDPLKGLLGLMKQPEPIKSQEADIMKMYEQKITADVNALKRAILESKQQYETQIQKAPQQYQPLREQADVQRARNERALREQLSAQGLQASGDSISGNIAINTSADQQINNLNLQQQNLINDANNKIIALENEGKFKEAEIIASNVANEIQALITERQRVEQENYTRNKEFMGQLSDYAKTQSSIGSTEAYTKGVELANQEKLLQSKYTEEFIQNKLKSEGLDLAMKEVDKDNYSELQKLKVKSAILSEYVDNLKAENLPQTIKNELELSAQEIKLGYLNIDKLSEMLRYLPQQLQQELAAGIASMQNEKARVNQAQQNIENAEARANKKVNVEPDYSPDISFYTDYLDSIVNSSLGKDSLITQEQAKKEIEKAILNQQLLGTPLEVINLLKARYNIK
jgi:hypothetical protein